MRMTKTVLIVLLCTIISIVSVGCEQPEYYHPYGEGVDPDTVTTGRFITRTTTQTSQNTTETTTTGTIPADMEIVVPEGYRVCPECEGIKIACEYCEGKGRVLGESVDPEVYTDYYEPCKHCSEEDPGYYFCETCRNELVIPN